MKNNNIQKIVIKKKKNKDTKQSIMREIFGPQVRNKLNFLPPWLETPMRYADVIPTTVTAVTVVEQVFRANSIFDPDRTGAGHQPLGHDQLLPMYQTYNVHQLRWRIVFPPTGLANSFAAVGIVNNLANYNTVPLFTAFCEAPRTLCKPLGSQVGTVFTGTCNLPPFIGIGLRKYFTEVTYSGAMGATNPGEIIELHIVTYNSNVIGSLTTTFSIEITYDTIVYDPILPAQS